MWVDSCILGLLSDSPSFFSVCPTTAALAFATFTFRGDLLVPISKTALYDPGPGVSRFVAYRAPPFNRVLSMPDPNGTCPKLKLSLVGSTVAS